VSEIGYDTKTRTITTLTIVDRLGNVRFSMGATQTEKAPSKRTATKTKEPKPAPTKKENAKDTSSLLPGGSDYAKVVAAYATGKVSKSGEDYRTVWAKMVNATEEMLFAFDRDVQSYKFDHNIQPVF